MERNIGQGPFTEAFDSFFLKHSIQRLKYFGGSLQGNDIHTVFKSGKVIRELASLVVCRMVVCGNSRVMNLGRDAIELERVLLSSGIIHNLFNRKEPLCVHEKLAFPSQVSSFAVHFAEVSRKRSLPRRCTSCVTTM